MQSAIHQYPFLPAEEQYQNHDRHLLLSTAEPIVSIDETTTTAESTVTNLVLTLACLVCASVCAGLILGILSLDRLWLHIKIRAAGTDPIETACAQRVLPLVEQKHLVLVSLLLLNFMADEALPLVLDRLLPSPVMAVAVSVFLVVFVSEILPSAIFIGPEQLKLAARVSPFAKFAIFITYPISYPISKVLDYLLCDQDEVGDYFNRGELSALVRIQYEGREQLQKQQQQDDKRQNDDMSENSSVLSPNLKTPFFIQIPKTPVDNETIASTEVEIMEGALQLKSTCVKDVCTRLRNAYTIPHDTILDTSNLARIYGVGYSRVPVYQRNPRRPRETNRILGVLMTRQLIVIDPQHKRRVDSLPLYKPLCVSPNANLVQMLHLFQTGTTGHLALVCEKPEIAQSALEAGKVIPPEAGVFGIITLEDVIEELLQEPIYDEADRAERQAMERAEWAIRKWKLFVKRKKKQREEAVDECTGKSIIFPPPSSHLAEEDVPACHIIHHEKSDDDNGSLTLPDVEATPLISNPKVYGSTNHW